MQQQTKGSNQKTREIESALTDGALLSACSFESRPENPGPQPSSHLPQPQEIATDYLGKFKREALHSVVHAFREAFGFDKQSSNGYTPEYLEAVKRFQRIRAGHPEEQAIRLLSSPRGYTSVRQAGRMRASYGRLSPSVLRQVCREIRAALVWRSKDA